MQHVEATVRIIVQQQPAEVAVNVLGALCQVAEFLGPDSLGMPVASLSAQTARSWESGFETMAGVARTSIVVVIGYDLEEVSLACIRLEECQGGHWVTVGHRVDELGRTQRTVTAKWETPSSDRPLGAYFTSIRRTLEKATKAQGEMDTFSSGWQRIESTLLGTAIALAVVLVTVTRDRTSATIAATS